MSEKPTLDEGASIETETVETAEIEESILDEMMEAQGDEPSKEEGESEEGDATEEQETQISTEELAQIFGSEDNPFDVNEEGRVIVRTQIDGKSGTAELSDLVRSYQVQGHLDNKSREVSKQQEALKAQAEQAEKAAKDKIDQLETLAHVAWGELNREYQAVNWDELRNYDNTEFLAKRAEYQDRQAAIAAMYQSVAEEKEKRDQTFAAEQKAKLTEVMPEWADESKAKAEVEKVEKYMADLGLNEENFGQVNHHQAVIAFRKAMLYDEMQKKKPETKNLVKKAAKVSRPGQTPKPKEQPKAVEDYFYN